MSNRQIEIITKWFGIVLIVVVFMLIIAEVRAAEVCYTDRQNPELVYCFDCSKGSQSYWCSKQVPQPHTCCEDPSKIVVKDSEKGDTFPIMLETCNTMYGYCVEEVAKNQEMYNGCAASKGLSLTPSLPVIERRKFDNIFECQRHEAACGYTKYAWQIEVSRCLSL